MAESQYQPNLAETLARVLPKAEIVHISTHNDIVQVAVPAGTTLREIDLEKLREHPRRMQGVAALSDEASFLAYVQRHKSESTVAWCAFNPATYALAFWAIFDDHTKGLPGWRGHAAQFAPALSVEWGIWAKQDEKPQGQIEFAQFLERNEGDIASVPGMPTSLQMMEMATGFESTGEKRVRSIVKLQGGGVSLQYVEGDDEATLQQMKAFDKFAIGIPVFWSGASYCINARLRYRQAQGKVTFWYELIRPDRVHEAAAKDVITRVRDGLGDVPMVMGAYKGA